MRFFGLKDLKEPFPSYENENHTLLRISFVDPDRVTLSGNEKD
jgi:hypothetical protein